MLFNIENKKLYFLFSIYVQSLHKLLRGSPVRILGTAQDIYTLNKFTIYDKIFKRITDNNKPFCPKGDILY